MNQPSLILTGAPSGGGKTAGVKLVVEICDRIERVVTSTSRPKRDEETNGVDYHFYDIPEFERKIPLGHFVECDKPYGSPDYYGVEWSALERVWQKGKIPLLAITLPGIKAFSEKFKDACSIYILVPSIETLKQRLIKRGDVPPEKLHGRLRQAQFEMATWHQHCRYSVMNEDGKLEQMACDFIAKVRDHYPSLF